MCGIAGRYHDPHAEERIAEGLRLMQDRGRDGWGIAAGHSIHTQKGTLEPHHAMSSPLMHTSSARPEPENTQNTQNTQNAQISPGATNTAHALGHCLHSMVGFVLQPLRGKGTLTANCEIYNWKELCEKYGISARNDAELLFTLLERMDDEALLGKGLQNVIDELDGPYAIAYERANTLILMRDLLGIKPIWYSAATPFSFASEKKVLTAWGCTDIRELNPRTILTYDIKTQKTTETTRAFLLPQNELEESEQDIKRELTRLLEDAVRKRIPQEPVGVLLSGGVDSALITALLKKIGGKPICYTTALAEPTMAEPEDLRYARTTAEALGVELRVCAVTLDDIEAALPHVISIIEESNAIKAGVALTFHLCAQRAHKDGIRILFSGSGSDELFGGYERYTRAANLNDDLRSSVLKLYEQDLYRDDAVMMHNAIELRLPYLDRSLVAYALRIPARYKIDGATNKKILRALALEYAIPADIALRKKKAAQYGSRMDQAIEKLARRAGYKNKNEYLARYLRAPRPRIAALWSTGKDSAFAAYLMRSRNYDITCLITLRSANPDSYMFHTAGIDLARMQSEASGIPLIEQETTGEQENELDDLRLALERARAIYQIEGVVTGAIASRYQRDRIEKTCDALGLKIYAPLWQMRQEEELRQILLHGFRIIMTHVAAQGLDETWLGKELTSAHHTRLLALHESSGINVAGEGGEYETLVLDCPLFTRAIHIDESRAQPYDNGAHRLHILRAHLGEKKKMQNRQVTV